MKPWRTFARSTAVSVITAFQAPQAAPAVVAQQQGLMGQE
jgi:hypothetical protein